MSTLVSVGNAHQSFVRLLNMVAECRDALPKPIIVQRGHTPFDHPEMEVVEFLRNDEFMKQLESVTIFISHAGAGSILNAISVNKKPIVCPRRSDRAEHIDDQQSELATACVEAGLVMVVDDVDTLRSCINSLETSLADRGPSKMANLVGGLLSKMAET